MIPYSWCVKAFKVKSDSLHFTLLSAAVLMWSLTAANNYLQATERKLSKHCPRLLTCILSCSHTASDCCMVYVLNRNMLLGTIFATSCKNFACLLEGRSAGVAVCGAETVIKSEKSCSNMSGDKGRQHWRKCSERHCGGQGFTNLY